MCGWDGGGVRLGSAAPGGAHLGDGGQTGERGSGGGAQTRSGVQAGTVRATPPQHAPVDEVGSVTGAVKAKGECKAAGQQPDGVEGATDELNGVIAKAVRVHVLLEQLREHKGGGVRATRRMRGRPRVPGRRVGGGTCLSGVRHPVSQDLGVAGTLCSTGVSTVSRAWEDPVARVRVHVCTKEGQLRPSRRRPSEAGRGSGLPTRNRPHRGWKPTGAGQAYAPHISARDSNATRGGRAPKAWLGLPLRPRVLPGTPSFWTGGQHETSGQHPRPGDRGSRTSREGAPSPPTTPSRHE